MQAKYFKHQKEFRKWLEKNHKDTTELLVGYYKIDSGKPSMTWSQSVDEALCFGWIDGVRRSVDEERYTIRFTPRKPGSNWSAINIGKVKTLTEQGLMTPEGLKAFHKRKESASAGYTHETPAASLDRSFESQLKANKKAWKYFKSMPPSYQSTAIKWVMGAKLETTRHRRMETLITDSEAGRKIKPLSY